MKEKVYILTLRENINASFESPCLGVFSEWEGAEQCLQEAVESLIPSLWNEWMEAKVDDFGDVEIDYERCVKEGILSLSQLDSAVGRRITTSLDAVGLEQLCVCTNVDYLYVTVEIKEFELK